MCWWCFITGWGGWAGFWSCKSNPLNFRLLLSWLLSFGWVMFHNDAICTVIWWYFCDVNLICADTHCSSYSWSCLLFIRAAWNLRQIRKSLCCLKITFRNVRTPCKQKRYKTSFSIIYLALFTIWVTKDIIVFRNRFIVLCSQGLKHFPPPLSISNQLETIWVLQRCFRYTHGTEEFIFGFLVLDKLSFPNDCAIPGKSDKFAKISKYWGG